MPELLSSELFMTACDLIRKLHILIQHSQPAKLSKGVHLFILYNCSNLNETGRIQIEALAWLP